MADSDRPHTAPHPGGRDADGSKRAIRRAGSNLLHEGHTWARRVSVAQRALRKAVDRGADPDIVEEQRRAVRIARGDDARLRAALTELERQVAASPEPDAEWTRGARIEAERVRAGREGRPDPTGGAPGVRRGWRDYPPAIVIGIGAWIVIATAITIAAVVRGL